MSNPSKTGTGKAVRGAHGFRSRLAALFNDPGLVLIVGACGLAAAILAANEAVIRDERAAVARGVEQQVETLTRSLRDQVTTEVTALDSMLRSVAVEAQRDGLEAAAARMARMVAVRRGTPAIFILLDAQGAKAWASRDIEPAPGTVAGHLAAHRQNAGSLHISPAQRHAEAVGWAIDMSYPVVNGEGNLAGLVLVALNVEHLQHAYGEMNLGFGGVVQVLRNDGTVIARIADGGVTAGQQPGADASMRSAMSIHDSCTTGTLMTRTDGVEGIGSYCGVDGYPLQVGVSVSAENAMAGLNITVLRYRIIAMLLLALLAAGTLVMRVLLSRQQQTQRALRDSESSFRALNALGSDWYWETDAEYRLTHLSDGFSRMSGRSPVDLIGRPSWNNPFMMPVGADWAAHKAVIARRVPFRDLVLRYSSPHGVVAYGNLSGEPVIDSDGVCKGYRGIGNDITAEIVLRQRLRMQHDVTRILSQEKDTGEAIRAVIETICRNMEWSWGAHRHLDQGTSLLTISEYWLAPGIRASDFVAFAREPKKADPVNGMVSRAIMRSEIVWFTDHTPSTLRRSTVAREAGLRGAVAVPIRRSSGAGDALEFFSARVEVPDQVMLDTLDAISRELGQFLDRTEAQQSSANLERERRHLLDRLELQLEHMPIACLLQDCNFRIVYCNPAAERVFGYAAAEMRGRDTLDLLVPDAGRDLVRGRRARVQAGHANVGGINENITRDGRTIICEWSVTPLSDETGGFAGVLATAQDVTERMKMVATLEASEERYRQIFAAAPLPMWVAAVPQPRFLAVNDAAVKKYGYSREELMGMTAIDLQLPEDREQVSAEILDRDPGMVMHFERRHVTRDGRVLRTEVTAQPFQFGGQPARLIVVNDVTERHGAQQALEESEVRYRQIFALTPLPMYLRSETTLEFIDVNDACLAMYGYTRKEMLALTLIDIQTPADRERYRNGLYPRAEGVIEHLQKKHMRSNGEIFDVEIFSCPTTLGAEKVRLVLVRDITEQLHSAELLRDSERRVALAMEGSGGALFDWDVATGAVYLSDRWNAMLGGELRETLTTFRALEEMMHPDDLANQRVAIGLLLKSSGAPQHAEFRVRTQAGNWIWIESRGSVIERDGNGRALRVLGTNIDVTQRKQAEITLRERDRLLHESAAEIRKLNAGLEQRVERRTLALAAANRELESFSYSVSHDLRAPLRTIDGFSQILLEEYSTKLDATGRGYLERVRAGSQRMAKLIDDLLELARVTRRDLQVRQCDLTALAREIAGELRAAEPTRQARIDVAESMVVAADSGLLRIALDNLLRNAWKFTGSQPVTVITVGCTPGERGNTYFVRDNGVGFDMAYVNKLFGAFQRLHSEAEFQGTGIGLALVQRVIRRHGGQVWAEAALNRGATFYFTLPEPAATASDSVDRITAETWRQ